MGNRSARRELERDALRTRIDGNKHIDEINKVIGLARGAYMTGDKDAVPALKAELDARFRMLDKVLPTPRPVELNLSDADGPVLILDMVGQQAFIPPQLEVIEGEIVGVNEHEPVTHTVESTRPDSGETANLFD